MQERHTDIQAYFKEQEYTTKKYVIPYVAGRMKVSKNISVLEIGCGEAGNLKPFVDLGCKCVGVDLNEEKINFGKELYAKHPNGDNLELIVDDIYNREGEYFEHFDLIILRDVIEHIHNQEKFLHGLKKFIKPGGQVFFGFPPWQNPFGGHQQICNSKILSVLPYFHLLPKPLYIGVLKMFGESKKTIADLVEIKDTGISIERFERILRVEKWKINKKTSFFINPNYEIKFKLTPRESWSWVASFPFVRNFLVTACYYLVSKE